MSTDLEQRIERRLEQLGMYGMSAERALEIASEVCRQVAIHTEETEPYAHVTIAYLREAASTLDLVMDEA